MTTASSTIHTGATGVDERSAQQVTVPVTRFSRPRFALLVLIGVYPIITVLLYVVLPLTEGWTIWQRTLVIAPLMVAMMIWGLIPQVQTRFRTFLNPMAGGAALCG